MLTAHGHYVEGTPDDKKPEFVVPCGYLTSCLTCQTEVHEYFNQKFIEQKKRLKEQK